MSSDREQKGKRYLTALFLAAALLCAGLLCAWLWEPENRLQQAEASAGGSGNRTVLLGGMPVGIYMETDGVMVLSTESLEGVDGEEHEPAAGIVRTGDYITAVNEKEISRGLSGPEIISRRSMRRRSPENQNFSRRWMILTGTAWC